MYNLEKLLYDNLIPFQRTSLVRPGPRPNLMCSFPLILSPELNGSQESAKVWKKNKITWKQPNRDNIHIKMQQEPENSFCEW